MNYTIRNARLEVQVSGFGAELQSVKGEDGTEYLWQGDPAFWPDRAPNIFPYVARLTQGRYTAEGREYKMKIHGFIKYRTLQVEEQTKTRIVFRLDSDEETRSQYPYEFIYRIVYELRENVLNIVYSVANHGNSRMYFGLGGHPGFRVPLEQGLTFEDYYLEFGRTAQPCRIGFTDDCFLNGREENFPLQGGRRLPLRHALFDRDAIVLKHADRRVRLTSEKGNRSVTVAYPDFQYIGFWHKPQSEAPYVCIEPWSSLPSREGIVEDFSRQEDLISLDSGQEYTNHWMIEIE